MLSAQHRPHEALKSSLRLQSVSQAVSIAAGERFYLRRGAIIRPPRCRLWRIVHEAAYAAAPTRVKQLSSYRVGGTR
jgi:hypothetical protein